MGRLKIRAAEFRYKELDRCLKEIFINGLNDDYILVEITCTLTSLNYMNLVTSEQVLA